MEKISQIGWAQQKCTSPNHDPPGHISLKPGMYKHRCSKCGHETYVVIDDHSLVEQTQ